MKAIPTAEDRAVALMSTSVEDARSTLALMAANEYNVGVVRGALKRSFDHGQKVKCRMFRGWLKRADKTIPGANSKIE